MVQLLLFLHVLGAIIAVGASFAFPLIAGQARKAPQHSHFAALVIDDRGRIAQVLSPYDKAPRTQYHIDGKGRTLVPGMIDAHLHTIELGLTLLTLDLSQTKSLAEAQAKIIHAFHYHPYCPPKLTVWN